MGTTPEIPSCCASSTCLIPAFVFSYAGNMKLNSRLAFSLALVFCAAPLPAAVEPARIDLDYVIEKARERAEKPFHSPRADLPSLLKADQLTYDKYRLIQFRRGMALWSEEQLPVRVEFFHPGYLYEEPVRINEFTASYTQPIRFARDFFQYGEGLDIADKIPARTGYAGFKLVYELNAPGRWDELGAFLGASYYRLLGQDQRYGQSARGLALDCGEYGRPEEFPIFTDWWLGKPQPGDKAMRLFAILDSVSCVGAYEFRITPGKTTVAEIEAVLLFRRDEDILRVDPNRKPRMTIGLAPLTSMFWFGKNSERKFDDYRLEVHDSDGMLVQDGQRRGALASAEQRLRHAPSTLWREQHQGLRLAPAGTAILQLQDMFNYYHQVPASGSSPRETGGKATCTWSSSAPNTRGWTTSWRSGIRATNRNPWNRSDSPIASPGCGKTRQPSPRTGFFPPGSVPTAAILSGACSSSILSARGSVPCRSAHRLKRCPTAVGTPPSPKPSWSAIPSTRRGGSSSRWTRPRTTGIRWICVARWSRTGNL